MTGQAGSSGARAAGAPQPRAKRRPYRREQILAAAVELFREKGYHATGIDEIGAASGITGPAIYRHFSGKEDILEALLLEVHSTKIAQAREILAAASSPEEGLAALVALYVDWVLENPALGFVGIYERRTLRGDTRRALLLAERQHTEQWIHALQAVRPELTVGQGRVAVHAATGLAVSAASYRGRVANDVARVLIAEMMLAAMMALPGAPPA